MNKFYLFILFGLIGFLPNGIAQLNFSLNSETVSAGGTVDIDVVVSGFNDIAGMQGSLNWDPTILEFNSIQNVTTDLPEFSEASSIGTSPNSPVINEGQLTFSWSLQSTNPFTLADNTRLFTIRCNVVGDPCDMTAFVLSDNPRRVEAFDGSLNSVSLNLSGGEVDIMGTDCGGGSGVCTASSDVSFIIDDFSLMNGANFCMPVIARNFTNVESFQTGISFNSNVLNFDRVINGSVTPVNANPNNGSSSDIRLLWTEPDAGSVTVADGDVLFQICFDGVGNAGQSTNLEFGAFTGFPIEFTTTTGTVSPCLETASATIEADAGADCTNSTVTSFIISDDSFPPNANICVPITGKNINLLTGFQSGIIFNSSVLQYTGINDGELPGVLVNDNDASNGELILLWSDVRGLGYTIADDLTLFELCFDVVGAVNSSSSIEFGVVNGRVLEFSDPDGVSLDFCVQSGTIDVDSGNVGNVTLIANDITIQGEGNGCVEISVQNFTDIQSAQFNLMWDESIISYDRIINSGVLDMFGESMVNFIEPNVLRVTWSPFSPQSVADNSTIFEVCFDVVDGLCDVGSRTSSVDFVAFNGIAIEFTAPDNSILTVDTNSGSVFVDCMDPDLNVTLISANNPSCNGDADGSISVSVTGGVAPITCIWKDDDGNEISSSTTNCNLNGVPAGTYTLMAMDSQGTMAAAFSQTLEEESDIEISTSATHPSCDALGSISANASGGVEPLVYCWNQGIGTVQNPANLGVGVYILTVTDDNGCTNTGSVALSVENNISITVNSITNPGCADSNSGSIDIDVSSGCPDYTFVWGGDIFNPDDVEDPTNLPAGTYGVTVTDNVGNSAQQSVTIDQGDEVNLNSNSTAVTNMDGNNGAIDLMISGGTSPYTAAWADGPQTEDRSSLSPGSYTVTVTDDAACTAVSTIEISWNAIFADNILGGRDGAVSCVGETDGFIDGDIIGGCGGNQILIDGTVSTLPLENLGTGDYLVEVSDMCGNTDSKTITIIDPNPITIEIEDSSCSNGADGMITILVSGGSQEFDIMWSRGVVDASGLIASELAVGDINVVVNDSNGCQAANQDIQIEMCDTMVFDECEARSIISPNGDAINDNFVIQCPANLSGLANQLNIYDRWGRVVFTQNDYDNSWTGLDLQGNQLDEGGYMWVLEIDTGANNQIEKGTVTVLR